MTEEYLRRPLPRSVVGDATTAKASHQWNRLLSRMKSPGRDRSQFRRSRKKVLPTLLGAIILLAIAGLATALLKDGLLSYALLAVGGLTCIYIVSRTIKDQEPEASLGLGTVSVEDAMYSLSQIAAARDQELAGHSERVAGNSLAIGRELGLSHSEMRELWWAGLLHDVGKIGVSESILQKPGPLTEVERLEVQRHSEYGAQVFAEFCSSLPSIADGIRFHHERWDGLGYPSRLSGKDIPLFARIVAIADTFEALTGPRPYRSAMSPLQACVYIRREAGRHFDPGLVRVFDVLFREGALLVAESHALHRERHDFALRDSISASA